MASADGQAQQVDQSASMQRQQQELIKLLAQHFNNQFYQLTNSARPSNNLFNGATNLASAEQQSQQQQIYQHQPLPHQYRDSQQDRAYLHSACLNESSGLNLVTCNAETEASSALPGHFRPQPEVAGLTLLERSLAQEAPSLNQANSLHPYPFSLDELNLFSALGLNLTNNQLVLSLQQQSLLRAATSAKQYELSRASQEAILAGYHNRGRLYNATISGKTSNVGAQSSTSNLNMAERAPHKDLLKFSINTILGADLPPKINHLDSPVHPSFNNQTSDSINHSVAPKSAREELKVDSDDCTNQCDQLESSSDASFTNTPAPIQPSSSSSARSADLNVPADVMGKLFSTAGTCSSVAYMARATNNRQQQAPVNDHNRQFQQPHSLSQNHHHPQPHHSLPAFMSGPQAFPWTVASRGKPRRGMMRRAVFSDNQRVGLEKRFQLQKYISKPDRKKLAEKLGLRDSQVKIWFQNRRMKWRNSKERELLSAGGSREQTLPTRNNPNPDLSDVGETIKRLTESNCGIDG